MTKINATFFKTQSAFRKWLLENHEKEQELWVGYYKKASGIPSIDWPQSVNEALCFGWIDGIRKSIDQKRYMIRFTPRRPGSIWSAKNLKSVEKLIGQGLMQPAGMEVYNNRNKKMSVRYSFEQKKVELPDEYMAKIRANKKAWEFFQSLAPSYKKPSIWWVISAKREETRLRRLDVLIESSSEGRKIPPFIVSKKK